MEDDLLLKTKQLLGNIIFIVQYYRIIIVLRTIDFGNID